MDKEGKKKKMLRQVEPKAFEKLFHTFFNDTIMIWILFHIDFEWNPTGSAPQEPL